LRTFTRPRELEARVAFFVATARKNRLAADCQCSGNAFCASSKSGCALEVSPSRK
jgi:hypothetical protein